MRLILIFSALFLLACETVPQVEPEQIAPETQSDCIDTGENIECASYDQKSLKAAATEEELHFDGEEANK